MIPQRCLVGGEDGDCYRACIATLCEHPCADVPNFGAIATDIDEMYRLAREWLRDHGFGLFQTYCSAGWPLEKVLRVFSADNPGVPIIISGRARSNPDETHAVIALNGEIAHDPSGAGVSGPWECACKPDCERGWWWIDVITSASVGRNPEGQDAEERLDAEHEHAVGSVADETPAHSRQSNKPGREM